MKLDPDQENTAQISKRYQGGAKPFDDKIDKIILDHRFSLFDLHAKQRMDGFRSYLVASAVIFAAFAAMCREGAYSACAMISFVFLIASFGFCTLDLRALQLIKISESALTVLQAKLRASSDWHDADKDKIEFFRKSDFETHLLKLRSMRIGRITYRHVSYKIFAVMSVLSLVGFVVSLFLAM